MGDQWQYSTTHNSACKVIEEQTEPLTDHNSVYEEIIVRITNEKPNILKALDTLNIFPESYVKSRVSSSGGAFPAPWFGGSIIVADVSGDPVARSGGQPDEHQPVKRS